MPYRQTAQLEEKPIVKLDETVEFAKYASLQSEAGSYKGIFPGRLWFIQGTMHGSVGVFKDVYCYSDIVARFVWNRSGGTLAQGALTKFYSLALTNITSGAVGSITDTGAFVADEQVGNLAYILDDAAGGGPAPEGQMRLIVKNTANIIYVQPNFTVAPAANDDVRIISRCNVIAAASGDNAGEVAGVVVAPNGIADNYGGWVVREGIVAALIKAATAVTGDEGLIADAGRLTVGSSSDASLIVAHAVVPCSNDIVSDLIPVEMCGSRLAASA